MSETQKMFHYNINSLIDIRIRVPGPKKMDPTGSSSEPVLTLYCHVLKTEDFGSVFGKIPRTKEKCPVS
jgi:hypothetical protein